MRILDKYRWRLWIWESDYGRDAGWIVELKGEPIALLTDPYPTETFWDRYRLTPITDDPELRHQLFTDAFWAQAESLDIKWRNRVFGDVVPAYPALSPLPEPGWIAMRGLYMRIPPPRPWDRVVLWLRRVLRLKKTDGSWHKDEARQRAAELDSHPETAVTRDELWKRVDHHSNT